MVIFASGLAIMTCFIRQGSVCPFQAQEYLGVDFILEIHKNSSICVDFLSYTRNFLQWEICLIQTVLILDSKLFM